MSKRGSHDATNDEEARMALQASDKLYYRIGEVSKLTGVKAHVLRYWETEFRWMVPPKSRSKQPGSIVLTSLLGCARTNWEASRVQTGCTEE